MVAISILRRRIYNDVVGLSRNKTRIGHDQQCQFGGVEEETIRNLRRDMQSCSKRLFINRALEGNAHLRACGYVDAVVPWHAAGDGITVSTRFAIHHQNCDSRHDSENKDGGNRSHKPKGVSAPIGSAFSQRNRC